VQREGGREGGLPSVAGLLRVPPPGDLAGRRPSGRSAAPPRDDEDARRRPPPPPRPSSSRVAFLRRSLRPLQPAPRSVPQSRRPLRDAEGVPIASSSAAARVHARIRGMPFDRVIMEKWDQVQRGGGD